MIKNVIFDIDGTLIDSNRLHAESWQRAFAEYGKIFDFEKILKQIGKGADQLLPVFLTESENNEFGKELEEHRSELFQKEYMPKVKPFPDVRRLVEKIIETGGRVVLASSASDEDVEKFKKIMNIEDLLEDATSADDAESSKPEPDIFLAALKKLNNPPKNECLIVGDTPYDAIAASKANLEIIGVTCGGWREDELKNAGCKTVYENPTDLLNHFNDWMNADTSTRSK